MALLKCDEVSTSAGATKDPESLQPIVEKAATSPGDADQEKAATSPGGADQDLTKPLQPLSIEPPEDEKDAAPNGFCVGWLLYIESKTPGRTRLGRIGYWVLIAFILFLCACLAPGVEKYIACLWEELEGSDGRRLKGGNGNDPCEESKVGTKGGDLSKDELKRLLHVLAQGGYLSKDELERLLHKLAQGEDLSQLEVELLQKLAEEDNYDLNDRDDELERLKVGEKFGTGRKPVDDMSKAEVIRLLQEMAKGDDSSRDEVDRLLKKTVEGEDLEPDEVDRRVDRLQEKAEEDLSPDEVELLRLQKWAEDGPEVRKEIASSIENIESFNKKFDPKKNFWDKNANWKDGWEKSIQKAMEMAMEDVDFLGKFAPSSTLLKQPLKDLALSREALEQLLKEAEKHITILKQELVPLKIESIESFNKKFDEEFKQGPGWQDGSEKATEKAVEKAMEDVVFLRKFEPSSTLLQQPLKELLTEADEHITVLKQQLVTLKIAALKSFNQNFDKEFFKQGPRWKDEKAREKAIVEEIEKPKGDVAFLRKFALSSTRFEQLLKEQEGSLDALEQLLKEADEHINVLQGQLDPLKAMRGIESFNKNKFFEMGNQGRVNKQDLNALENSLNLLHVSKKDDLSLKQLLQAEGLLKTASKGTTSLVMQAKKARRQFMQEVLDQRDFVDKLAEELAEEISVIIRQKVELAMNDIKSNHPAAQDPAAQDPAAQGRVDAVSMEVELAIAGIKTFNDGIAERIARQSATFLDLHIQDVDFFETSLNFLRTSLPFLVAKEDNLSLEQLVKAEGLLQETSKDTTALVEKSPKQAQADDADWRNLKRVAVKRVAEFATKVAKDISDIIRQKVGMAIAGIKTFNDLFGSNKPKVTAEDILPKIDPVIELLNVLMTVMPAMLFKELKDAQAPVTNLYRRFERLKDHPMLTEKAAELAEIAQSVQVVLAIAGIKSFNDCSAAAAADGKAPDFGDFKALQKSLTLLKERKEKDKWSWSLESLGQLQKAEGLLQKASYDTTYFVEQLEQQEGYDDWLAVLRPSDELAKKFAEEISVIIQAKVELAIDGITSKDPVAEGRVKTVSVQVKLAIYDIESFNGRFPDTRDIKDVVLLGASLKFLRTSLPFLRAKEDNWSLEQLRNAEAPLQEALGLLKGVRAQVEKLPEQAKENWLAALDLFLEPAEALRDDLPKAINDIQAAVQLEHSHRMGENFGD